jgi:hypothetical protein
MYVNINVNKYKVKSPYCRIAVSTVPGVASPLWRFLDWRFKTVEVEAFAAFIASVNTKYNFSFTQEKYLISNNNLAKLVSIYNDLISIHTPD